MDGFSECNTIEGQDRFFAQFMDMEPFSCRKTVIDAVVKALNEKKFFKRCVKELKAAGVVLDEDYVLKNLPIKPAKDMFFSMCTKLSRRVLKIVEIVGNF